jgi:flagellar motility protein MotE (MotC chaperone)
LILLAAIATVVLWFLRIVPDPTGYWEWRDYERNSTVLVDKQTELDKKQAELDQRETDLNTRETALKEKESALTSTSTTDSTSTSSTTTSSTDIQSSTDFESMLKALSDEKLTEIKKLATIYSKMDAAAAATVMEGMYSNDDIALIVYYMTPASAASVLAKMNATLAASITTLVVR